MDNLKGGQMFAYQYRKRMWIKTYFLLGFLIAEQISIQNLLNMQVLLDKTPPKASVQWMF